jgi:hypothetical protein
LGWLLSGLDWFISREFGQRSGTLPATGEVFFCFCFFPTMNVCSPSQVLALPEKQGEKWAAKSAQAA